MSTLSPAVSFSDADLLAWLARADDAALDDLPFGVIGLDIAGQVQRYNRFESRLAGLSADRVLGRHLFTAVAPCMNNALVAGRFERARVQDAVLDELLPYALTLRMRPVKVMLRLLADPAAPTRYVLVRRPD